MSNELNITICFTVGKSWSSKLIRWFTRSKISHAMVVFDDHSLGIRLCLSADSNGFVLKPWEKDKHSVRAEFKPIGPDLTGSLRWLAKEYLNTGYDFWAAGMTGMKNRLKWLWGWLRSWVWRRKDPKKVMCSESVIRMERLAGYKAVKGLEPELTDQQVLLDAHLEHKEEFEVLYVHHDLKT